MRLTTFTDYSLRVLIYLGARPEKRARIADVAAAFAISENHLVKVVHFLGKEGLLETTRGHGGGMRLAVAPERINIADVVRRTEGGDVPAECFEPDNHRCVIAGDCRLRGVLQEAVAAFYSVLAHYSLADLVRDRAALAKLLFPVSGVF